MTLISLFPIFASSFTLNVIFRTAPVVVISSTDPYDIPTLPFDISLIFSALLLGKITEPGNASLFNSSILVISSTSLSNSKCNSKAANPGFVSNETVDTKVSPCLTSVASVVTFTVQLASSAFTF